VIQIEQEQRMLTRLGTFCVKSHQIQEN